MMVEIRRMGPQIGVEVTGVDVKRLDDKSFAPIYQAWLDHNVLVVRDQELEIPDFLRYSCRFGPVVPHPSKSTRHTEFPEITMLGVNKFDGDGQLNQAGGFGGFDPNQFADFSDILGDLFGFGDFFGASRCLCHVEDGVMGAGFLCHGRLRHRRSPKLCSSV